MTAMKLDIARDYVHDFRKMMDQLTDGMDSYNAGLVAVQLVDKLRQDDPDLLNGWLQAQAVSIVKDAIRARDASIRAQTRQQAAPSAFDKDAKKFAAGNAKAMDGWLQTAFVVDDQDTRKHLGDMTKTEVAYTATNYEGLSKRNAIQAAFLRAVAKKTTTTVRDAFDNETLGRLWESLDK